MSNLIKAAVIGHPINHSKSPLIHNYWIEKYGLRGSYEAIDLSCEDLKSGVRKLVDEGYAGFNITVPHKESIVDLCDKIESNAQNIGAVNTVVIENGRVLGMNTDAYGFLTNITQSTSGSSFGGKCAVVLGAGGAARAVIGGLMGAGISKIILTNRTKEKSVSIKKEMDMGTGIIEVAEWDARNEILREAALLVNTTILGMNGQPPLEIDLANLSQRAVANDIVYAPLETLLLKNAKGKGIKTVGGIGMLLHQAAPAFKAWFGIMPEIDETLMDLVLK